MPVFLLMYWRHIAAITVLVLACFLTYNFVYQIGYNKAETTYQLKIKDYEDKLNNRITGLESLSHSIANQLSESRLATKKDFDVIKSGIKGIKTTEIINNQCQPSQDFIGNYNSAIERANKK